jgi:hypothetical protein
MIAVDVSVALQWFLRDDANEASLALLASGEQRAGGLERLLRAWNHLPSSPRKRGSTATMDARFRGHDDKSASEAIRAERAVEGQA